MVVSLLHVKPHEICTDDLMLILKLCTDWYSALCGIQYQLLDNVRLYQYRIPNKIKRKKKKMII